MMREQNNERYEYVENYDQDLRFGPNRFYTALFNLENQIMNVSYGSRWVRIWSS